MKTGSTGFSLSNGIRTAALTAVLLFFSLNVAQALNVAGTITGDTTWTASNSPYRVTDDITIPVGVTLTVEPGVVVQFDHYMGMFINGTLSAVGASDQRITFTGTSQTPGWWGCLYIYNGGSAALEWCDIAFGGNNSYSKWDGHYSISKSDSGSLSLRNSIIRNSDQDGLRISSDYSSFVSSGNIFSNNGRYGVNIGINSSFNDNTSVFTNNASWDAYVNSGIIDEDVTLSIKADYSFFISDNLNIATNGSLTVLPGTTLKFEQYRGIFVNGSLTAEGTALAPIYFTDYRDDSVGGDANKNGSANTPGSGWWGAIRVETTADASLQCCDLRYAGNNSYSWWGGYQGLIKVGAGALSIVNSSINRCNGYGMTLDESTGAVTIDTTMFTSNTTAGLYLNASEISAANCVFNDNGSYGLLQNINDGLVYADNIFTNNGTAGVAINGGTRTNNWTLNKAGNPFRILGVITIDSNTTCTLQSGTTVVSEQYQGIYVDGQLTATGTQSEPVVFTGSSQTPGWWGGLRIRNNGSATLDWCDISYGGNNSYNLWQGNNNIHKTGTGSLIVRNSILHHSSHEGLRIAADYSTFVSASNTFRDNSRYGVGLGINASFDDYTSRFTNNASVNIYVDTGTIDRPCSLSLSPDYSFYISDNFTIATNGSLTIHSNTVLKFDQYHGIFVDGQLTVQGTSNAPVYFTDPRDDSVGGDTNKDGTNSVPGAGWWGAICIRNAGTTTLEQCHIRYGGNNSYGWWGGYQGIIKSGNGDLSLNGCSIRQCYNYGLAVVSSSGTVTLAESVFSSNTACGMYLSDGPLTATNCTFSDNTNYGLLQEVNDGLVYADNIFTNNGTAAVGIHGGTRTNDWVLNKAGNPFRAIGIITIDTDTTLTIHPGALVEFDHYQGIYIDGQLTAEGTQAEPIRFTGTTETPDWWGGLRIRNAGSATIDWSDIAYGGNNSYSLWDGNNNIHKTGSGSLILRNSTLRNSSRDGLRIATGSSSFISSSNTFRDNNRYGVAIGINASFDDNTSVFTNNTSVDAYLDSGTINRPVTLSLNPQYSFYMSSHLTIGGSGTLNIQPGTVIKFPQYVGIYVDGALNASGTSSNAVYFTDIRDDSVGGDANKDGSASAPSPGWWGCILLRDQGSANLEWSHLLYAGNNSYSLWGGYQGIMKTGEGDLELTRCRIARTYGNGLSLNASKGTHSLSRTLFESNSIGVYANALETPLNLTGNQFISNTSYGVYCEVGSSQIDARRCWWGDPSGPYQSLLNTNGLGNPVSERVYFDPWRQTAAIGEIVAPPRNAEIVVNDSLRFVAAPYEDPNAGYLWNFGDGRTNGNRYAGLVNFPSISTNLVTMALVMDGVVDPVPDTRTVTVITDPGNLPDLAVTNFPMPSGLMTGQQVSVSYTTVNLGDGPLTESVRRDSMYLSTELYLDNLATLLNSVTVTGALTVGSSWTGTIPVTLRDLEPDNYQLIVAVDDGWQLPDKRRLNGECTATTTKPYFFWQRASQRLFHGTVTMDWSTIGVQDTSATTRITATFDNTVQQLATAVITSNSFTWDTTTSPDGQHFLKAAPSDGGADYPGQPFIDCMVNNSVNWRGGYISSDETWTSGTVYVVESALQIRSNVTVTVEAGAVIKFADGTSLTILDGGALIATNGVAAFTSLADDTVGGDTNMDGDDSKPYPGSWLGISAQNAATLLLDDNTVMRYIQSLHTGTALANELWAGSFLHIVSNEFTVPSGLSLRIEPGAVIKMHTNASIVIESTATLTANGLVAKPIVFTSIYDDSIAGDANQDGDATTAAAGDWKWIYFNSANGAFDHCEFRYGGGPAAGGWGPGGGPGKATIKSEGSSTLSISNSIMMQSCFDGVLAWGGPARIINSLITGSDRGICAHPYGIVTVMNSTVDDNRIGLLIHGGSMTASNSIIANNLHYGVLRDNGSDLATFGYNCFWNSTNISGTADVTSTNGNFVADPSFKDRTRGAYQLQFGSPCIDAANSPFSTPTDIMDAPRYTDPRTNPKRGIPDAEGVYADLGAYEFVENADSDLDLVIAWVEGPDTITAGSEATIRYQIVNQGTAPVSGDWHDQLFLLPSLAEAGQTTIDLGDALVSGTIAPNQSLIVERNVTVPYATEGEWRWQAQVNAKGEIFEGRNWMNNYSPLSAPVQLTIPRLTIGQTLTNTFAGPSSPVAVAIEQQPGQDLLIRWRAEGTGTMRLYAGYNRMPTISSFDLRTPADDASHVRLGLSAPAAARTVYIKAQPNALTGSLNSTVSAELATLDLEAASPATAGNAGSTTLRINGSGLSTNMILTLQPTAGGTSIQASRLQSPDSSQAYATFPLTGVTTGQYNLVAYDGTTVTLTNALQVKTGAGGRFTVNLLLPEAARIGRTFDCVAEFKNVGDADIIVPLLSIYTPNGTAPVWSHQRAYQTEAVLLQLMAIPDDGAPFGVLRPGQSGSILFYSKQTSTYTAYKVDWDDQNASGTVEWDNLRDAASPPDADAAWSNAFNEIATQIGPAWSNLVPALSQAAAGLLPCGVVENRPYKILDAMVTDKLLSNNLAPFFGTLFYETNTVPLANTQLTLTDETGNQFNTYSWIDGRFVLETLPQGSYTLEVPGYLPRPALNVSPYQGDIDLTVQPGASLVGRVLAANEGLPVTNVTLTLQHDVHNIQFTVDADDSGLYRITGLPVGSYLLTAQSPGWITLTTAIAGVTSPTSIVQNLTMSRGGTASGTVLNQSGSPVTNALVQATDGSGAQSDYTLTDYKGSFTLAGLADGTYSLLASASTSGIVSVSNAFTITQASTVTGLTVSLQNYASLLITVTNATTGLPATNVSIAIGGIAEQTDPLFTDDSGLCRIDTINVGETTIWAYSADYQPISSNITIVAGSQTLNLLARPSASATVALQWVDGSPLHDADILIVGTNGLIIEANTDNQGQISFAELYDGTYTILIASETLTAGRPIAEVSLSAGNAVVTTNITLSGTLVSGHITDHAANPITNTAVTLMRSTNELADTTVNSDGAFAFLVDGTSSVSVIAYSPTQGLMTRENIDISATNRITNIDLSPSSGKLIINALSNPGGFHVTNLWINISPDTPIPAAYQRLGFTDTSGQAIITNVATNATMHITAYNNNFAVTGLTINTTGTITTVNVPLPVASQLTGTILGTNGAPLDRTVLMLSSTNHSVTLYDITGTNGSFTIKGIIPGNWILDVLPDDGCPINIAPLNLSGGLNTLPNITIPAVNRALQGSITSAEGIPVFGTQINLVNAAGETLLTTASDDAGNWRIQHIPTNAFTLRVNGPAGSYLTSLPEQTLPTNTHNIILTAPRAIALNPDSFTAQRGIGHSLRNFKFFSPVDVPQRIGDNVWDWARGNFADNAAWRGSYNNYKPVNSSCEGYQNALTRASASAENINLQFDLWMSRYEVLNDLQRANAAVLSAQTVKISASVALFALALEPIGAYVVGAGVVAGSDAAMVGLASASIALTQNTILSIYDALNNKDFNRVQTGLENIADVLANLLDAAKNTTLFGPVKFAYDRIKDVFDVWDDLAATLQDAESSMKAYNDARTAYYAAVETHKANIAAVAGAAAQNCPDPDPCCVIAPDGIVTCKPCCPPPPKGCECVGSSCGGNPGGGGGIDGRGSWDPNDKQTTGYGAAGHILPGASILYTIRFENQTNRPSAEPEQETTQTLPAQRVYVSDQLTTNLDWSTFELVAAGFNNVEFSIPSDLQSYSVTTNVITDTYPVDFVAEFNEQTGLATWTIQSRNPATEDLPDDMYAGFLPPNTNPPSGEGWVSYRISAKTNLANNTIVTNMADIYFDFNPVIVTPAVTNTIDTLAPTSTVTALPAMSRPTFTLAWSGNDHSGVDIAGYNIYRSLNSGAFSLWLTNTTSTSAEYTGSVGDTIAFYAIATDHLGLQEDAKTTAEAQTTIAATPYSSITALPEESEPEFTLTWSGTAPSGSPITNYNIYSRENTNDYSLWLIAGTNTSATFTGTVESTYYFYSIATDAIDLTEPAKTNYDAYTTIKRPGSLSWILLLLH